MRLSLAMIAKNEAGFIGHCLASVQGLVDEAILVDTGSEDATVEIARQYGAEVSHFPWGDDFSAARNQSLARCTGDWLLILDADEAVDVLDHEVIRQACAEPQAQAFRLILRNYLPSATQSTLDEPAQPNTSRYREGREHSHYSDFRGLRLCRRFPELRFEGRIHELLDPYFMSRNLAIRELDAVIHHYGKLMKDREALKGRYYLDLAREDARREPTNHQFHFNIVQQGLMVRDWAVVLEAAETYLKLQAWVPHIVLLGAGIALHGLGRFEESLAYLDRLLKMAPNHAMALTQRGISLAHLGRVDQARASFRKALKAKPGFLMPFLNLMELECGLGNGKAALAAIEEGLAQGPTDPLLLQGKVKLDLMLKDVGTAVEDARRALACCPREGEGLWHRLVALSEQQQGNTERAREILRAGLEVFPEDAELLRLWARFSSG
jgi:glycosyltransferase involved in cell wall biosynthesis